MFKINYNPKALSQKTQSFYLQAAGISVKFTFKPTDLIFFKKRIIEDIIKTWGNVGYLTKTAKRKDFEIVFKKDDKTINVYKKKNKHFFLTFVRHFKRRRVETFYYVDLLQLQMLLKEIFSYLLMKKGGFLLHGSGAINRKNELLLFFAQSGGGKTTVSNLISSKNGYKKFCDDMFIAKKVKNKWFFFSSPFIEKVKVFPKRKFDKAQFFFIKKAKKAKISEFETGTKALRVLLEQIWLVDNTISSQTLQTAMDLVEKGNCFRLYSSLNRKEMESLL